MSGHNKWSKIKRQKGVADLKKGKVFSQISKAITLAAKKGGDPEMNSELSFMIEKAKQVNMPSENVEKAIKKGTGELEGGAIEEVLYEAYGPGGIALIIEATTDNTNRTVAEIKHLLTINNGRLGEAGSVKWMFDRFGFIEIKIGENKLSEDELEMAVIEAGAEDFDITPQPPHSAIAQGRLLSRGHKSEDMILTSPDSSISEGQDDIIVVYTKPENLYKVKENLENSKIKISEIGFEWKAKNKIKIEDEKVNNGIERLFEALDEQEDVAEVYSNLEE